MMKLVLSSKFVLSILSLVTVLYKKALKKAQHDCFFEREDVNDQKEINNFLF